MTKLPDMQQAVNDVEGVAAATMRWPEPEGPAFMRIEFDAGADEGAVAERVLEVLRQTGGVDTRQLVEGPGPPDVAQDRLTGEGSQPAGRPAEPAGSEQGGAADAGGPAASGNGTATHGPATAVTTAAGAPAESARPAGPSADAGVAPAANGHAGKEAPGGSPTAADVAGEPAGPGAGAAPPPPPLGDVRVVLERVNLERTREDTTVEVTLQLGGQLAGGRAVTPGGEQTPTRVAAEATLAAVQTLVPQAPRLELWGAGTAEDQGPAPVACVWVRRLTDTGEQQVSVGSAIIRQEPADAVVRATLDALNRWLPLLRGVASRG